MHMALDVEINGLYLLLLDREDTFNFHWGLYLANSLTSGDVFHIDNPITLTSWEYKVESIRDATLRNPLLLTLQVGDLNQRYMTPLRTAFANSHGILHDPFQGEHALRCAGQRVSLCVGR
jgi:hypothetical protein